MKQASISKCIKREKQPLYKMNVASKLRQMSFICVIKAAINKENSLRFWLFTWLSRDQKDNTFLLNALRIKTGQQKKEKC